MTNIDYIKESVTIEMVLSLYGIEVNNANFAICPIHKDNHPSMKIYPKTNTYHCFTCHAHGDVIQLVRDIEDCDFKTAISILCKEFNLQEYKKPTSYQVKEIQIRKLEQLDVKVTKENEKELYNKIDKCCENATLVLAVVSELLKEKNDDFLVKQELWWYSYSTYLMYLMYVLNEDIERLPQYPFDIYFSLYGDRKFAVKQKIKLGLLPYTYYDYCKSNIYKIGLV